MNGFLKLSHIHYINIICTYVCVLVVSWYEYIYATMPAALGPIAQGFWACMLQVITSADICRYTIDSDIIKLVLLAIHFKIYNHKLG